MKNKRDRIYIGIDNGTTGSIAIIEERSGASWLFPLPIKLEQSYTKFKQNISRIDSPALHALFEKWDNGNVIAILERPMVNPGRFKATMSALRCLEAVLVCVEYYGFAHMYCDSKDWQSVLLPHAVKKKGKLNLREKVNKKKKEEIKSQLKKESLDIAKRLFPKLDYSKVKDGDAILIAEWARRQNL
jgi:hypothetical protein